MLAEVRTIELPTMMAAVMMAKERRLLERSISWARVVEVLVSDVELPVSTSQPAGDVAEGSWSTLEDAHEVPAGDGHRLWRHGRGRIAGRSAIAAWV